MATKYPKSAQTGDEGVALVRQIVTEAGAIYRGFETPDLGVDGMLELLTPAREPSGDFVLAQIKCGASYVRGGRFFVDADRSHFETWARYALPVVGIVCDPDSKTARWVDISSELRDHPERIASGPYAIEASAPFSAAAFAPFLAKFTRSRSVATRIDTTPNLLIREWQDEDALPTLALLQPIAIDYPGFDRWLKKKFADPTASKKIVAHGSAVAAFSMWQAKDDRNVKLQTFMVGSLFRGTAIGQHLLYHELRTWARNPKIERVHVTVSSRKADLIEYFKQFGFRVEGFAPNRYAREDDAAELIMAKHFVRRVVRTPAELTSLVDHISRRLWGIRPTFADRFGVGGPDVAIHAVLPAVTVASDPSPGTVASRVTVAEPGGILSATYDDATLMADFFPLRMHLPDKRYVLIPIFRQWVEAMLSTSGPGTPLKLRVDNVYYCYPKLINLARGDLAIFYEPKKEGGLGAAVGAAVVLETAIDEPARLHERYSVLGVYKLEDVAAHVNRRSHHAMAIRFGLFEPFETPVTLERIRAILGNATNVQGLTPIARDSFESIRSDGMGQP